MDFSEALKLFKDGKLMQRQNWNGKGMYAYLVKADEYLIPDHLRCDHCNSQKTRGSFGMVAADGSFGSWTPVAIDILAEDWQVIE